MQGGSASSRTIPTNKLSKMKQGTKLGSRIAEIHNGSVYESTMILHRG